MLILLCLAVRLSTVGAKRCLVADDFLRGFRENKLISATRLDLAGLGEGKTDSPAWKYQNWKEMLILLCSAVRLSTVEAGRAWQSVLF